MKISRQIELFSHSKTCNFCEADVADAAKAGLAGAKAGLAAAKKAYLENRNK